MPILPSKNASRGIIPGVDKNMPTIAVKTIMATILGLHKPKKSRQASAVSVTGIVVLDGSKLIICLSICGPGKIKQVDQ